MSLSDPPPEPSLAEQKLAFVTAFLEGTAKLLGVHPRLAELMRRRGWPVHDLDLRAALAAAICLSYRGAGLTPIRRPLGAEKCGGKWPEVLGTLKACEVVVALELTDLLTEG